MTVDLDRIYWTNRNKRAINSVLKANGTHFIQEKTSGAPSMILAYGDHIQPMPGECLLRPHNNTFCNIIVNYIFGWEHNYFLEDTFKSIDNFFKEMTCMGFEPETS